MPDRSQLEDKAMAVGLIALGAALPLYEVVSGRIRTLVRRVGEHLPLNR